MAAVEDAISHSRLYISVIPAALVGAFAGILTSVMGVGGGFILVPAMVYLLNMRTSIAIGTSLFEMCSSARQRR